MTWLEEAIKQFDEERESRSDARKQYYSVKSTEYLVLKDLISKTEVMTLSANTQGGNRKWDQRDPFLDRLAELVDEFYPMWKRTPSEEAKFQQAINSW